MDVSKLFKSYPPVEPLTSLEALVRDWRWRTAPGGHLAAKRDDVVMLAAQQDSFERAVEVAVKSRRPDGRMHNHQTKVREADRGDFGDRIMGVWGRDWHRFKGSGFDNWYDRLEDIAREIPGIGAVTTYDVAVRIGAWMGIEPESLYLHAGVRLGWLALEGVPGTCVEVGVHDPRFLRGAKRVRRQWWPEIFRDFKADDFEDFLCTYRGVFPTLAKRPA